jgi:hypothetical protein
MICISWREAGSHACHMNRGRIEVLDIQCHQAKFNGTEGMPPKETWDLLPKEREIGVAELTSGICLLQVIWNFDTCE